MFKQDMTLLARAFTIATGSPRLSVIVACRIVAAKGVNGYAYMILLVWDPPIEWPT